MAYRLNVDMWHVVNPDDQKIYRLAKGDEVPSWALDNEGIDVDALSASRVPIFIKDEEPARSAPGEDLAQARSESPERPRDRK